MLIEEAAPQCDVACLLVSLASLSHAVQPTPRCGVPSSYLCTSAAEVRAKVLRVDTEAGKLSLGLKPSYFEDDGGGSDTADSEDADEDERDLDEVLAEELDAQQEQHAAAQVQQSRCVPLAWAAC